MTTRVSFRFVLTASLPILAWTVSQGAAAEKDPWERVPAFPTGWYTQDGYADKLGTAQQTLERDIERQETINKQLTDKIKDIDPMELASRQQQYMMENPEEAMKLMQRNQTLGAEYSNAEVATDEERKALWRELQGMDDRYKAALEKQLAPMKTKYKDLDVRAQKDLIPVGEAYWAYAPWAVKEYNQILVEETAAYEKLGAEWWGAAGPYHGWLKRYREIEAKRILEREEAELVGAGFVVQLVGTPEASFKPVAGMKAVRDYMLTVNKVFAGRRQEPGKAMEVYDPKQPTRR